MDILEQAEKILKDKQGIVIFRNQFDHDILITGLHATKNGIQVEYVEK